MKTNQRKIGALLSYVSIFASTIIQLLYTPFLISKLGKSEYGLYSLVSSIIGYLTVLDLGFGNAIVVHTAKYRATGEKEKEQKLHGMFHIIYIIIGIIAGLLGVLFTAFSDRIFSKTLAIEDQDKMKVMLIILSFNLFVTFAFSIYNSIISANERFVFQKIVAIINTIAKPLLMVPILFMGYRSIALCIVITAVNISVLLANYIFCKKKLHTDVKFRGFDKKLLKTILAYSFWIFLTQIVDKINWSADQTILGAIVSKDAVSVYSVASTLNLMFINLSTAISGVMLPKISKMVSQKTSNEELTNEFIKVGRIQYYVIFLMASGLVLFGKQFIKLWLGDGFEESYRVALIIILPVCLPLIQNLGLSIMQAMNKYKFKAISTFIMSLVNIIISIILARKYGATGAAIGTAIGLIVCNIIVINIYYAKEIRLGIARFWNEIIKMTLLFLVPTMVGYLISKKNNIETWSIFVICAGLYSIMFGIYSYFICMNNYEKSLIAKAIRKRR